MNNPLTTIKGTLTSGVIIAVVLIVIVKMMNA